ncbi:hypothetical protein ACFL0Z_00590 [Patescibacteria group bacterium]
MIADSMIITVVLSTVLILVLLILRDLQNMRIAGEQIVSSESGQENLEFIGKLRYHQKKFIDMGSEHVPSHVKEYRLGFHKPGNPFNIKTVKNENYERQ